ncbi:MAG: serine/threonine-protein kinase [Chthoniobacterales bacterium]
MDDDTASPPESTQSQILEACPACGTLIDVTEVGPFSEVNCPSCGESIVVRKQFNNFTLQALLGRGGMGEVYKALDMNLNRDVALKILKTELSISAEERDKLEREAHLTASINHPHVVKVFSFGESRGQFYLAMELVEKGTLDDLMGLQRRIAEAQALDVGIQIASGLQAAAEVGLIHRDIKPGNILFADAHTAKLVDFGLALVMDEAAAEKGEIWGTPYYIAPEKLDQLPEDFRSDIYSLGGTLFHAIAGRPPYEAETASMVALKQLKSMPVSLEAFAPDVLSETAYVINRMMAKDPEDRYQSYEELIEHLTYAREKLNNRPVKTKQSQQSLTVESNAQKKVVAASVILILLAVIGGGWFLVQQNGGFSKVLGLDQESRQERLESFENGFTDARQSLVDEKYEDAAELFGNLVDSRYGEKNARWMRANEGLALLMAGQKSEAEAIFKALQNEGLFSNEPQESALANFFVEIGRIMGEPNSIAPATLNLYSKDNFEAFAFFLYGMKNWQMGDLEDSNEILNAFRETNPVGGDAWISDYKSLLPLFAKQYLVYEKFLKAAEENTDKSALLAQIREAQDLDTQPETSLWNALEKLAEKIEQAN